MYFMCEEEKGQRMDPVVLRMIQSGRGPGFLFGRFPLSNDGTALSMHKLATIAAAFQIYLTLLYDHDKQNRWYFSTLQLEQTWLPADELSAHLEPSTAASDGRVASPH